MTKQEQQDLKLIVYRMDEADKRVESLHKEFKNDYKVTQISNLSKKIYSILKQFQGQKPNKTHNLENLLLCERYNWWLLLH